MSELAVIPPNIMGKTGGGFESFKLFYPLFKAIKVKGYKVPTPIQRRAMPPLLSGNDVIATARTGSGKTAAFLIPIIQKLQEHSMTVGARAVVISPTRELAIQTCRFSVELTKFTSLRIALLTGGEGLKQEFEKLSENPDIVIATPGRLMHMVTEIRYSLVSVQIVVLDEADRLVELGMFEQVQTVLKSMTSESRQTVMISASMPEQLADYVKTGLNNPVLVKLDQERRLPETLTLKFYYVRKDSKEAMLLYLLRHLMSLEDTLTLVFVATKHHVEYLDMLIKASGLNCAGLYGDMDQQARETTMDAFRKKQYNVLIVTDVAARGIDIPLLDYTVQYDFASNPRLFINRVGRVARAGKTGTSFSLIAKDEVPYFLDTMLHIGRSDSEALGAVPESLIQTAFEELNLIKTERLAPDEVNSKRKSVDSALKLYYKTRISSSMISVRRAKELTLKIHPDFASEVEEQAAEFSQQISAYRPDLTIVEMTAMMNGDRAAAEELKRKRLLIGIRKEKKPAEPLEISAENEPEDSESEVEFVVSDSVPGKRKREGEETVPVPVKKRRGQMTDFKDPNFFLSSESTHFFDKESDLTQLSMSIPQEDELGLKLDHRKTKWCGLVRDKKKKKYIKRDEGETELVPGKKNNKASVMYRQWRISTKKRIQRPGEVEDLKMRRNDAETKGDEFHGKSELKTRDQLLKSRKKEQKMQERNMKRKSTEKRSNRR